MPISRSLTLAVLGFGLMLSGCDRQGSDKAQPQVQAQAGSATVPVPAGAIDRSRKGSRLPDFTLASPDGKKLRLVEQTGQPLLVNLWATWCGPCVAELPQLDALAKEGKVRVITVSQDMGEPQKVAAFLHDRGVTRLEPWLDPNNDLSFHYQTGTLPTTILYNSQGREVWRYIGGHDWAGPETRAMLAEAGE